MGRAGALLFLASVGTARATLALLDELGEPVGARRWLIYPPLVLTYVTMSTVLILLPPTLVATAGDPTVRADAEAWLPAPFWLGLSIGIVGSAGIWWSLLGLLLARHTDVARTVFWPLAEWFERRHALSLALVGLALVVIAGLGLGLIFWAF
jgi:hypothetical protein